MNEVKHYFIAFLITSCVILVFSCINLIFESNIIDKEIILFLMPLALLFFLFIGIAGYLLGSHEAEERHNLKLIEELDWNSPIQSIKILREVGVKLIHDKESEKNFKIMVNLFEQYSMEKEKNPNYEWSESFIKKSFTTLLEKIKFEQSERHSNRTTPKYKKDFYYVKLSEEELNSLINIL